MPARSCAARFHLRTEFTAAQPEADYGQTADSSTDPAQVHLQKHAATKGSPNHHCAPIYNIYQRYGHENAAGPAAEGRHELLASQRLTIYSIWQLPFVSKLYPIFLQASCKPEKVMSIKE